MTTDKYLSQINRCDHVIKNKMAEIQKLSNMATSISISPKEVDVQSSGNPDKMGSAVAKIADLQNEIKELVCEFVEKRRVIIGQIDSMENTDVYIVLYAHYVDNKDWNLISVEMGYSYRNIMRLKKRALQEFEKRYGEIYIKKST